MNWTEAERAELERLGAALREDGWADFVTVERLLANWQQLVSEVDRYRVGIDDFTNDLTSRDGLEWVLGRCSGSLAEKLRAEIAPADDRYRSATREDDALSRFFRVDASSGWWWRRAPTSGPLAEELAGRK